MNIILSMTLSGSLVFIIYSFFEYTKILQLSLQNRYMIVKAVLFFHFMPLGYLSPLYLKPLRLKHSSNLTYAFIDFSKPLVTSWSDGHYINSAHIHHLTTLWFFISLMFFLSSIFARMKLRKQILDSCEEITSDTVLTICSRCQAYLGIKKIIPIYWSDMYMSAFTYGIFRQIIIVPKTYDTEELELAIFHEFIHIKRNDSFILFLDSLAMKIYWFNPLLFLIHKEIDTLCELSCDEFVIQNRNKEKRKLYARLIVTSAASGGNIPTRHITSFNKNKKIIKERIDLIVKEQNQNCKYPLASLILSAGIILCGTFPALTCEPPQKLNRLDHLEENLPFASFIEISDIGYQEQKTTWEPAEQMIYNSNCNHSFIQNIYTIHTPTSNGGCVLEKYSAQRCTQCGYRKDKILIDKNEYTICPH